jgi:L,D-transpeptidase YcbB
MHDTPLQRLFAENYRFLSHGCVRVDGVDELAIWLLNIVNSARHWDRKAIDEKVQEGDQKEIRLSKPVPVGWVYLDAWESADGVVHFAPDIYDLDSAREESRAKLDGYKP